MVLWVSVLLALYTCVGNAAPLAENPKSMRPSLPREYVDTAVKAPSGRTWTVPANGDLQAVIDEAQPGDEIVLKAGAQYEGPFMLPNKRQSVGWIIIRSSGVNRDFPPPGSRVLPTHAEKMAALVSRSSAVIFTEKGAHHFRFIGVEMKPSQDAFVRDLMLLGDGTERSIEELPHHIIIDRCFLHGDPKKGARRGVVVNGQHMAVIDSYLSDFKETGQDTQAVAGWAGTGVIKITNNYLEASGENILFGGAERSIRDLVPSDIEVRRNNVAKPLAWKPGEPESDGTPYQVKILFELKSARRVLVDGNIFEYNWQRPGYGFAVNLTVRNEVGHTPWAVIEDLTFTNNIVRHSPSGVNIMGNDDHFPSGRAQRIAINNNIFDDINGNRWGGKGRLFQLTRGTKDVVIEHNTAFHTGHVLMASGDPQEGFMYRYNITPHNEYGMEGEGTGVGRPTFERHLPGAIISNNILIGGEFYAERYPEGNTFPASMDAVPFINAAGGDYRLTASNTSTAPSNREVPGVDAKALCAALGEIGRMEPVCRDPLQKDRSKALQAGKSE
jgi:hypothetical protein